MHGQLASAFDRGQGAGRAAAARCTEMSSIPLPSAVRRAPLPFRPLFLCAGAFATFGMLAWGLFLHLGWMPSAALAPIPWHAHAMLYGFAGALIGGFVLTASGHWTGMPTTTPLTT